MTQLDWYDREGERSQAQQVTQLRTCLSDIAFVVGRPVCSTGTASGSKLPGTSHAYISRHRKAPPVDLFTVDDVKTTFDDCMVTNIRVSSHLE